jgi:hypothetical protein
VTVLLGFHRALALLAACAVLASCEANSRQIDDQIVEVGCGLCQFKIEGNPSCYWAVRIKGVDGVDPAPLMARGDVLPSSTEHDSHGEGGMCQVTRTARVSGTVYPTYFLASGFELLPLEPGTPSTPHEHKH